ncbi:hypothetical protein K3N28_01975 [Glycomyces sp. TRM65418]|uniref:hypothetical protein n=1 Tax=Glycomyces sp. TRM65418 TaxID=2867006 RepID=UPI001CE6EF3F|nr:hypothetical protein [Glycomyces sp. TRM65418]MCC3761841.1 hypothetical protein [Glycomyces sp. TRM65418]QZD55923.1 hypothetical protein K3N28_01965 [Glycomyces sp. TRM65418]
MPEFAPVRLPHYDGRASGPHSLLADVAAWTGSPPMRRLLDQFGGALPGAGTAEDLAYLEAFSADHWDFRAGRERHETAPQPLDPEQEHAVTEAALALGLGAQAEPRRRHYTHVLVLGGLVASCLFRTRFAAELLANGVEADNVTGVGGFRPLDAPDRESAALSGIACGDFEVDAIEASLKRAFGIEGEPHVDRGGDPRLEPSRAWKVATFADGPVAVRAVAAPSSQPDRRRADTVDTCRFWADRVADLSPGDSVLVVTSAPYTVFQHCDAITHMGLPYGCAVDTVAVDPAQLPEPHFRKEHTASGYLQEVRSAIRSMQRLYGLAYAAAQAPTSRSRPHRTRSAAFR